MRKVRPEDEIPVRELTDRAVARRLSSFNGRKAKKPTTKKGLELLAWLDGLDGQTMDVNEVLKRIYKYLDYYMRNEINDYTVCRAGCGACCYVPVMTSTLEAAYISNVHDIELDESQRMTDRVGQGGLDACPFHDKDTAKCRVYNERPMGCRLFATFDHWKHCENPDSGQAHAIHCFENQPFFKHLHEWLIQQGLLVHPAGYADIRDWFKDVK